MHTYIVEEIDGKPKFYTVVFYYPGDPTKTGNEIGSFRLEADAQALVNYLNGGRR